MFVCLFYSSFLNLWCSSHFKKFLVLLIDSSEKYRINMSSSALFPWNSKSNNFRRIGLNTRPVSFSASACKIAIWCGALCDAICGGQPQQQSQRVHTLRTSSQKNIFRRVSFLHVTLIIKKWHLAFLFLHQSLINILDGRNCTGAFTYSLRSPYELGH